MGIAASVEPSLRCRFHDLEQPAIWSSMPPRFNESTLINATNTSMINDTQDDSNSTGVNASNMTCMYPNASTIAPDVCGPLSVLILHCVSSAAVAIRDGAKQLSMAASLTGRVHVQRQRLQILRGACISIFPASGPLSGSTMVEVRGHALKPTDGTSLCRFQKDTEQTTPSMRAAFVTFSQQLALTELRSSLPLSS